MATAKAVSTSASAQSTVQQPEKAPKPEVIHFGKRDSQARKLKVVNDVWSSVKVIRQPSLQVLHFDWTHASLKPYAEYKKLYGERKFAKGPITNSKTIFLDLPAEIRNNIYGYLLHFPSLELAAKSPRSSNSAARMHQMRYYKYTVQAALKLLRTCKQVNKEASSIFYGENEFHFTAGYGIDILKAFCRTIGMANTSRLTTITLHVPFPGKDSDHENNRDAHESGNGWWNFKYLTRSKMGMHEEGYGNRFPIHKILSRIGVGAGLQKLRLVVPDSFHIKDLIEPSPSNRYPFYGLVDKKKLQEISIEIVLLENEQSLGFLGGPLMWQPKTQSEVITFAESQGWAVSKAHYDDKGRYDVFEELGGSIVEDEEELDGQW